MKAEEVMRKVLESLAELKARDVTSLDVRKVTTMTDYMIVASGTSSQHIKSIATQVVRDAKKHKLDIIGIEGEDTAEWVLIDLNYVIVHLMMPSQRVLYQLESLWQVLPEEEDIPYSQQH